jgi:hypothetical protein
MPPSARHVGSLPPAADRAQQPEQLSVQVSTLCVQ